MPIRQVIKESGSPFPIKVWCDDLEETALQQAKNIAKLPFIHKHVALMADAHWGKGTTVGCVLVTDGVVIPASVGVDIGCGMCAVKTNLTANDLPDDLSMIRHSIERSVPVGFNEHKDGPKNKDGSSIIDSFVGEISSTRKLILEKHPSIQAPNNPKYINQIGTLGGGNHFIEICLDQDNNVWVMLHSGSRNTGKILAEYFITKAKEHMAKYFITLPDEDLAYLPENTEDFDDYIEAVMWAQDYASFNRKVMLDLVVQEIAYFYPQLELLDKVVNCHHNYISREYHYGKNCLVTRKGAVKADNGDLGIIPGSMGAQSFIVRGKGNPESFNSCSHGAGRAMSRGEAKRRYTVKDLESQTDGVECRKDKDVIDEIPSAYKSIKAVMENQTDLVDVLYTLKQIVCIKG